MKTKKLTDNEKDKLFVKTYGYKDILFPIFGVVAFVTVLLVYSVLLRTSTGVWPGFSDTTVVFSLVAVIVFAIYSAIAIGFLIKIKSKEKKIAQEKARLIQDIEETKTVTKENEPKYDDFDFFDK